MRRNYRPEQIINKVREAEVLLSQGSTVGEATEKIRVIKQIHYRRRREYGGMRIGEVIRLNELKLARLSLVGYREVFLN